VEKNNSRERNQKVVKSKRSDGHFRHANLHVCLNRRNSRVRESRHVGETREGEGLEKEKNGLEEPKQLLKVAGDSERRHLEGV